MSLFDLKEPPQTLLESIVKGVLIQGLRISQWWRRQRDETLDSIMRVVRQGVVNGESNDDMARRIQGGRVGGVTVPGIMRTTRRKAAAIAATAVSAVQNRTRQETFQANSDLIKGYQQVSTLDNKTSDICIAYSGEAWDLEGNPIPPATLPFNGGPPRHFNCRSTLVPVLKSFRELGIDLDEIPEGTRASMDGQVPGDISFSDWLKTKPNSFADELLGPKRARLWRNGKISLRDLVDMRGEPMTLDQLEQLISSRGG